MARQKKPYLNSVYQEVFKTVQSERNSDKDRNKYDPSKTDLELVPQYLRESDGFTFLFAAVKEKAKDTIKGMFNLNDGDKHVDTYHDYQKGAAPQSPLTYAALQASDDEDMFDIVKLLAEKSQHPADALRAVLLLPDAGRHISKLIQIPEIAADIDTHSSERPAALSLAAFHCNELAFNALMAARNVTLQQMGWRSSQNKVYEDQTPLLGHALLHQAVLGADDSEVNFSHFICHLIADKMPEMTNNPWPIVDINATVEGVTALALACALGKQNIIGELVIAQADINQALKVSAWYGNHSALDYLLNTVLDRPTTMTAISEEHPLLLALKAERQHLLPSKNLKETFPFERKYEPHAQHQWVQVQETMLNFLHRKDVIDSPYLLVNYIITTFKAPISRIDIPELRAEVEAMHDQLTHDYTSNARKIAECVHYLRTQSEGHTLKDHAVSTPSKIKQYEAEKAKLITENAKILGQLYALNELVQTCNSKPSSADLQQAKEDFLTCCELKIYSETNRTRIAMVVGALTGIILGGVLGVIFAILATGGTAAIFVAPTTANLGAKIGAAVVSAAMLGVIGGSIGESTENTQVKNWRDHFFAVSTAVDEITATQYAEEVRHTNSVEYD